MTPLRSCIISLLLLAAGGTASAGRSDWALATWQSDDGLPNNNVAGLVQTSDGYLWVATPSGLARFDGDHFDSFQTGTFAPNYENQRIRVMIGTRQSGLCVGVEPGHLIFLQHGTATIFTNGLPLLTIESLSEDVNGAIWIGYHGGTVVRVKDGVATKFGTPDGLPRGGFCDLAVDTNGTLWFSKGFETGIFRDGRFKTLVALETAGAHLAATRDGGMWICSGSHLYKYYHDRPTTDCGFLPAQKPRGTVNALLDDHAGGVWIGTSASGLFHYDGTKFEPVNTSDREILSLASDREGNWWVGTGGGGLNRLRLRSITLENAGTGMPFEAVQSLCQETNGAIWATAANGSVLRHFQDEWKVMTNDGLANVMAYCVASDRTGGVWIGTGGRKIFHWRDGAVDVVDEHQGLVARSIHRLLISRDGDLWVCGELPDSLQVFRDGRFTELPIPPGMRRLRTLTEDAAGNIWIGGDRGALLRISDGRVIDETFLTTNVQKTIRCFHAEPDGALWIGFASGGLGRLKDGKLSRVDVAQGLYVGAIDQILDDGLGSMWFGSDQGIFRVRKKDLNAVADGKISMLWSIHYGRSEGLPSVQAHYGDWPGALRCSDGQLWIPMRTGLAIVDPKNLREDLHPPPVFVNEVAVDDQPVALYGGNIPTGNKADLARDVSRLRLAPDFHRLEFEFTAISFGPPENIHFRYQLEGFDDHWRDAGNLRSAIYSRLAAGHYRFRVQGCNSDGIWNNDGAALAFSVDPFFWQTWWFRLAAILGFTVLVVAVVRYVSFRRLRTKLQVLEQQSALDKERARIARDIHDDLGGTLTQVALLSGLAQRDVQKPGRLTEHVQQISTAAQQGIKSMDEIVWAVNPRNDTLPDLINYLGQFAVDFLRTAGIQCQAELPDHPPRWPVTSETRHHLYLVVKETLNNITRHSHADRVQFRVDVTDQAACIIIEDNGKGFRNGEADAFADGVRNMRQRMEEIGGYFKVESTAGKGTRTELNFGLKKS